MIEAVETEDHVAHDEAMDVDPTVPKKRKKAVPKLKSLDDPVVAPIPAVAKSTTAVKGETASRPKKVVKAVEKQDTQQQRDKGKKRSSQQSSLREEGPKAKKARITHSSPEPSASRPLPPSRARRGESKLTGAAETKDAQPKGKKATRSDARNPPPPEPKAKQRKARPRSPSPSPSASSSSSFVRRKGSKQKQVPEIDPELCGMLIECMATSRASSLPMSTLYKIAMQSYPSLKSRGTERECLEVIERVLEAGTVAGGGTGVFGKVQSNTKVRDRVAE